jgi:hypothetical protein
MDAANADKLCHLEQALAALRAAATSHEAAALEHLAAQVQQLRTSLAKTEEIASKLIGKSTHCSIHRTRQQATRPASAPCTRPEPFPNMELHSLSWKSRQQQHLQKQAAEKLAEEAAARAARASFLRSKECGKPFDGVLARSQEMLDRRSAKMEAHRVQQSAAIATSFKAKPVALADEDWNTLQERAALKRKQRVEMRKAQLLAMSKAPQRMAMHALETAKQQDITHTKQQMSSTSETYLPTVKAPRPDPATVREMLEKRQAAWTAQLAARKQTSVPVVCLKLPLEERAEVYKQKAAERSQRKEEKAAAEKRVAAEEEQQRRIRIMSAPVPAAPRSTMSHMLKAKETQSRARSEAAEKERNDARDHMRATRQQAISADLAAAVRDTERERKINSTQQAERVKAEQERYRTTLKENRAKVDEIARTQPSLLQRHDQQLAKETARSATLSAIAQCVYGKKQGDTWHQQPGTTSIFDDAEQAVLGFA